MKGLRIKFRHCSVSRYQAILLVTDMNARRQWLILRIRQDVHMFRSVLKPPLLLLRSYLSVATTLVPSSSILKFTAHTFS